MQLKIFLQAVNTNSMSLHLYGLTNEERPADTPLQIETPAGTASVFDGVASGYGTWAKTGAGSLTLKGLSEMRGALAVTAGALIIADGATGTGAVAVAGGATACGTPAKDVFFTSPQTINGPEDLSGWTVTGVNEASLMYSDDRTAVYFSCPRGSGAQQA